MKEKLKEECIEELKKKNKRYKYLYEIKQTHPKPGEAIYYRGSRNSELPPEQDFWIKYFTSSKLVKKKVEKEGIHAFEVVEIKLFPEDCNLLYEEYLYLTEVDARNNPLYFNQHNNEGYNVSKTGGRVCIHCYHQNYGSAFEPCWNCGENLIEFRCVKCGNELSNPAERCSCGYSLTDDSKYSCLKCGKELDHPTMRCSCGYCRFDEVKYKCKKCGNQLSHPTIRCSCGYARLDDIKHQCPKCGDELNSSLSRCTCGYSRRDTFKYYCLECGRELEHGGQRCECGYCRNDDANYRCPKCDAKLKHQNERCDCGYSRNHEANYCCLRCGNPIAHQCERCSCGYARMDDMEYHCIKCGNSLKYSNERCSCGYARSDDFKRYCRQCGNELINVFQRCSCGYSLNDEVKHCCKNCGTELGSSGSRCPQCQIRYAGFINWRDHNPIYRLIRGQSIVFEGYKHLCIDFMENERICSKETGNKLIEGKIKVFKPRQRLKKYPNNFNYAGLRAEFVSYPE